MRKNIILITLDSLRYDVCEELISDYLPGFTAFSNAYAQGSFTPISIPSLLTGLYPSRLNYVFCENNSTALIGRNTTISRVLKMSGYSTLAIHSNPFISRRFGYAEGYDVFIDTYDLITKRFLPGWTNKLFRYTRRVFSPHPYLPAAGLNSIALRYLPEVKWPFFLWLHYMDTHGPYLQHNKNLLIQKLTAERRWRRCSRRPQKITVGERKILFRTYKSEISYTMEQLRLLLEKLMTRVFAEHTYFLFTSDHGEEFGEHGYYSHPRRLFDTLIHVPLLIAGPDVPGGKVVSDVVELTSIFPTACDLAGIRNEFNVDGLSLLPLIYGKGLEYSKDYAISEASFSDEPGRRSIRQGKWKYIHEDAHDYPPNQPVIALDRPYSPHKGEYLFDLEKDRIEAVNVARERPDKCRELRETIGKVLARDPAGIRKVR